uniref:Beta-1,4-mannosyl-glycoprotein beta-1,4-N-acetylglucosaminyltransferase n=1 Tax=viral metagenome TaxID=1070528 RepID=A0A6C0AQD6_9ZZZZ
MKIIDSFIFYNEIDLLFYRLSILDEYVDKFILVESTHTFTGQLKPLFYNENKARFEKFNDKIIHIIVHDFPFKYPNINYNLNHQWENEYYQRNCIKRGLQQLIQQNYLNDEDIVLTSDIDEIPNPNILVNAKNNTLIFNKHTLNRLALDMYYYNLYYRIGEGSNWHGIKLFTFKAYKNINLTFQQMRVWEHSNNVPIVKDGGWHLSYFGDIQFIINKIASYSHQEYNNKNFIDKNTLEIKIKNGVNLLNNSSLVYIPIEENTNLPYKYETYLNKFYVN